MKRWDSIDTARCGTCRIFTPTGDLVLSNDGTVQCTGCARQALDWEVLVPTRFTMSKPIWWTFAVTLAVTLAFPLAACVSQL